VRTQDHTAQLDRVDQDIQRNLRLLRIAGWLHRLGNATLVAAGIAIIFSTIELVSEPTPSAAIGLLVELLVIELDLILHFIGYHLRYEVESYAAALRNELETKGDGLRLAAAEHGLNWEYFLTL
jgi:hypothetical protein